MSQGGVLLLDDDDDMLSTIGDLVRLLTRRPCVTAHNLAELVSHRDAALACDDAILDINLGPSEPSGLEAYAWLKEQHFAGHIIFLTGHARSHPMVARARALDGTQVFQKPIETVELCRLLGAPTPPELL
ncbi:MAG TPA: response regulator [Polyangia bacterium]|nr:response regulator [Polyangia bacterium]